MVKHHIIVKKTTIQLNTTMENFKSFFLEASEQEKDIKRTLAKLPKSHSILIKGYKFKWESGNTLKAHDDHVGIINPNNKTITVAAPWNYGREFTLLHELGHKVWENFIDKEMQKEWIGIVKKTKHKSQQNAEELFCMAYANHFAKNKIEIHNHPNWDSFVKKVINKST